MGGIFALPARVDIPCNARKYLGSEALIDRFGEFNSFRLTRALRGGLFSSNITARILETPDSRAATARRTPPSIYQSILPTQGQSYVETIDRLAFTHRQANAKRRPDCALLRPHLQP